MSKAFNIAVPTEPGLYESEKFPITEDWRERGQYVPYALTASGEFGMADSSLALGANSPLLSPEAVQSIGPYRKLTDQDEEVEAAIETSAAIQALGNEIDDLLALYIVTEDEHRKLVDKLDAVVIAVVKERAL